MRENSRLQRIADQMQKELAELLQSEVKDPRVGMVTVSYVTVSKDLAHAKVHVTLLSASEEEQRDTLAVLQKAAGFLRSMLARRMNLRMTPKLKFYYDPTTEKANEISALIDRALHGG